MSDKTGYSTGQLFFAFLGGAAVGAAVALLNSPRSGKENREFVAHAARDTKNKLSQIPQAMSAAAEAARSAFNSSMTETHAPGKTSEPMTMPQSHA